MSSKSVEFEGIEVTVTRGTDGVLVVFIDTGEASDSDHEADGLPRVRVHINDGDAYDFAQEARGQPARRQRSR